MLRLMLAGLVTLSYLLHISDATAQEIVEIDTRPGVSQPFLIVPPKGNAKGAAILFPTEEGKVKFLEKSWGIKVKNGGWYGRSYRMFLDAGYWIVVVSVPSDQRHGIDTQFRQSTRHAADITAVVTEVKKRTGFKPFLLGTCRGSYSAASVGSKIDNNTISGIVLMSMRTTGKDGSLTEGAVRGGLKAPLLLLHHVDDDCKGTPYYGLENVADFFRPSVRRLDTVTVTDGWPTSGRRQKSGCGSNGAHKFMGSEQEVVDTISAWMNGESVPPVLSTGK